MYAYTQPKHPWCKKVAAKNLKKGHAEKDVKSKSVTRPPAIDGIKNFLIMITRQQNIISTKNTMAVKKVAAKNLKMAMLKKM